MKKEEVDNCSFSSWYNQFKECSIKSQILPIPEDVLAYLKADGVVLPEGSMAKAAGETDSEDEVDWDEDTKVVEDASWIAATNSLRCSSPSDVFLLLKSSDFISHDLNYPYESCSDCDSNNVPDVKYDLVLRQWCDLNPAAEFRCFVREKTLIGISQRHHSSYFPHLKSQEETIKSEISKFYCDIIKNRFPQNNYVFDVYMQREGKLYVIDFNPFGPVTDSLLFSWGELSDENLLSPSNQGPCFRYIQTEHGVQPNEYQRYGMPADFTHLTTGQDPHKLIDLLKMKTEGTVESSSEDEENVT